MRQILHLDLDAFYASVETLLDPTLEGKPLVVAMGDLAGRGVVATASYPARKFGVHSAMPLREALRLCPQAVVLPVRHALYSEYSERVMSILHETCARVEQVSIDEAYAELPPEPELAVAQAREIQRRIKEEIGLDCTIAVATNKLVSKVACNTVKPHGFIAVPSGEEQAFLAHLPIDKLPGAGKVTRSKLTRWNVKTIGDLGRVPLAELKRAFGQTGVYFHEAALGRDDSPIVVDAKPKSFSEENTFDRDTQDVTAIEALIEEMCEGVARALKREGYRARTVMLKLRYSDFTTMTRQMTFQSTISEAAEIRESAKRLLELNWDRRHAVRLVGVGVHNLVEAGAGTQLQLKMGESEGE